MKNKPIFIRIILLTGLLYVVLQSNGIAQNIPYSLPEGFPRVEVTGHSDNPSGYYFMNTMGAQDTLWLMTLDSTGLPVYYHMFHHIISNFTVQHETGTLTYWNFHDTTYYEMDSSYQIINSYRAKNGYITDGHELRLKADGSYWIMSHDPQIVDMSQIIEGGNPAATVIGFIIQHIATDGDLLFEWRSWDHFDILDADSNLVNFRGAMIDYVHGNALDFDSDSTILLSCRCMDEITKINTNTGNIIWRWGGKHNEFTCTNDTIPFLAQHDIRFLGNGIYSLFDNGIAGVRFYSRAMVYSMNENNKTTTVLNDFQKDPSAFSRVMGSNQQLPNGNYQVGWSYNFQKNVLSEFNENGDIVYEMKSMDTLGLISYRALKFAWHTNIFSFENDTLDFGEPVFVGDSLLQSVTVYNNSQGSLVLNNQYITDTAFRLKTDLPIVLSPGDSKSVEILFKPDTTKHYSAVLSLFHDSDTTRFGQQIRLTGGGLITNINQTFVQSKMILFPNPANNHFSIQMHQLTTVATMQVFSLEGKKMTQLIIFNANSLNINTSLWPNGIYLIKIIENNKAFSKMLVVNHRMG